MNDILLINISELCCQQEQTTRQEKATLIDSYAHICANRLEPLVYYAWEDVRCDCNYCIINTHHRRRTNGSFQIGIASFNANGIVLFTKWGTRDCRGMLDPKINGYWLI